MRGAPGLRFGHGVRGLHFAFAGPQIRPGATLKRREIIHFHHALAAFADELQAAVQIENLDAVAATRKDAAQ